MIKNFVANFVGFITNRERFMCHCIGFFLAANCVASMFLAKPWECVAWCCSLFLFCLWRQAEARAEHYKRLCERAEAIFQKQLHDGKDHS